MQQPSLTVPKFRAALSDDQLTLSYWHPGLVALPLLAGARKMSQTSADYADLRVVLADDRRELIITFAGSGPNPRSRARFVEWAALVGYRRVWMGDELIDLSHQAPPLPEASVTCRGCEATIRCAGADFWQQVRRLGHFPRGCGLCGSVLPEWQVDQGSEGVGA